MEKINRLGWAESMAISAYGMRLGVRASDPAAFERLLAHLPPGWKPARSPFVENLYSLRVGGVAARPGVRRYHLLFWNQVRLLRTMELDEVFQMIENHLQYYVAERARRRVFVHAGVVGWRGKAIVIPGSSFSGKSTLVAALVNAGATYYSDEYAVFDPEGRVYPFARPLSLRDQDGEPLRRWRPEEDGHRVGGKPLPVGLVAISDYHPGAKWRPRPLSPSRAMLALLAHTVPARSRPVESLATLQQVASRAILLKGVRGEAEQTAEAMLRRLAT